MLLDIVSLVYTLARWPVSFANVTGRFFAASLSDVLSPFASPAYVLLAEDFHVSVDEVTSCFSAGFGGLAALTYDSSTSIIEGA